MYNVPILIILIDSKGIIKNYECRFDETICYTHEEIIGKNWFEVFIDPNDKEQIYEVFQTMIREDDTQDYIFFRNDIICKKGNHVLLDFHNRFISYNNKKYVFSIAIEHLHFEKENFEKLSRQVEEIYLKKWLD